MIERVVRGRRHRVEGVRNDHPVGSVFGEYGFLPSGLPPAVERSMRPARRMSRPPSVRGVGSSSVEFSKPSSIQ